jgi:hypothetical protein
MKPLVLKSCPVMAAPATVTERLAGLKVLLPMLGTMLCWPLASWRL